MNSALLPNRIIPRIVHCSVCDLSFSNQVAYLVHQIHHKLPPKDWLTCEDCNCVFYNECSFYNHDCLECKTNPRKSKKECIVCYKLNTVVEKNAMEWMYPSHYNRENSMNSGKQSQFFICIDCNFKVFNEAGSTLEDHIRDCMHFNIVPSETYNRFDLKMKDCANITSDEIKTLERTTRVEEDSVEEKEEEVLPTKTTPAMPASTVSQNLQKMQFFGKQYCLASKYKINIFGKEKFPKC